MPTDRVQQDVRVGREGVVAVADDSVTSRSQAFVAGGIFGFPNVVDAAVQFDDEVEFRA